MRRIKNVSRKITVAVVGVVLILVLLPVTVLSFSSAAIGSILAVALATVSAVGWRTGVPRVLVLMTSSFAVLALAMAIL